MLPSPGVRLSRCCAYQGSFLKSSKSVVNSLSISAKVPVFQGFSEIIKVVQKKSRNFYCKIANKMLKFGKQGRKKRKGGDKVYCRHCGGKVEPNAYACTHCGVQNGTGFKYCYNCGNPTDPQAVVCTKCGVALSAPGPHFAVGEQKSKLAAGLLALFLGALGIHNFYLGYTNKAVVQLLVSLFGGLLTCGIATFAVLVWSFVEGILILVGSIAYDANDIPLKP